HLLALPTRLCLGTQLTMLSFLTGEVADRNCMVHAWMFFCTTSSLVCGHPSTKPCIQIMIQLAYRFYFKKNVDIANVAVSQFACGNLRSSHCF
ncbi:hypothetical protein EV363DRAFT_1313676, partial [Boletus edulis]